MLDSKEDFELSKEVSAVVEEKFKEVWDNLSSINVNEHTEDKGGLTYLSWAWAYVTMMNNYPTFSYELLPHEELPDGTVMVYVSCTIMLGGVDLRKFMWLPVMDYRNNSIVKPDTKAINTANMRCLTKCISMYGLGAYIYAGEDLPQDSSDTDEDKPAPAKKVAKKKDEKKPEKKTEKVTSIRKGKATKQKPVEDDFYCEDEEAAEEYANFMIQTATEMHGDDIKDLIEFWKINIKATNYLKENWPNAYESVKDAFGELKAKLKGDE